MWHCLLQNIRVLQVDVTLHGLTSSKLTELRNVSCGFGMLADLHICVDATTSNDNLTLIQNSRKTLQSITVWRPGKAVSRGLLVRP